MPRQLSEKDIFSLRKQGLLRESEIAFKDGVTIIAEDLVTSARRIVVVNDLMLEANRQLLLD